MSEKGPVARKPFKFQIGLRWFLLLFMLGSAGIGWYLSIWPKALLVPAVMPCDTNSATRINEIVEYPASWVANEVREKARRDALQREIAYGLPIETDYGPEFELARKEYLLANMRRIHFRSAVDRELIQKYPDQFSRIARVAFISEPLFSDKVRAASVLSILGDPSHHQNLIEEFFANGEKQVELFVLCSYLSHEQTSSFPQLVEAIKSRVVGEDTEPNYRRAFLKQLQGAEKQQLAAMYMELLSERFDSKTRTAAIHWMLANCPSSETSQLALEFLKSVDAQSDGPVDRMIESLLYGEHFELASSGVLSGLIEEVSRLAHERPKCFKVVANHRGKAFESVFRKGIDDAHDANHLSLALRALQPHVDEEEFCNLLRELLRTSVFSKTVFRVARPYLTPEELLSILHRNWQRSKYQGTLKLICEITPEDQRASVRELLEIGFVEAKNSNESGHYVESRCFEIIGYLRKFGFEERAAELCELVPGTDEFWFPDSIDAEQYLHWFAKNFELDRQLKVADVFEADRRSATQLQHYPGVFTVKRFKVAAFQLAGLGKVVDPADFGIDGRIFAEIASLSSGSFEVETHETTGTRVRLLINARVYEFMMDDDWSWYDNAPACDALNAILERRHFEERFFVFGESYGNSYVTFVLFAKPENVRKFVAKNPEFNLLAGCEKYWVGKKLDSSK